MSVELPRECEWSRLFLNSGSSETNIIDRKQDCGMHSKNMDIHSIKNCEKVSKIKCYI